MGPAAGGAPLLAASETALATVLGVVQAPTQVDRNGWQAQLRVERVIGGALAETRPRIAWEELAPGRPPRFRDGSRVLVALVPLPGGTLWLKRFPDRQGYAVAARGTAFLRDPDAASVDGLAAWLAVPVAERGAAADVEALSGLAAHADPDLADAALQRLDTVPGLDERLTPAARDTLAGLLVDAARPHELRVSLLQLTGRRRLMSLRDAVAALDVPESPLRPQAIDTLAGIDGGLSDERVNALLASADPALRAAGARHAGAARFQAQLRLLLREDPAPAVRAAAVGPLIASRRAENMDAVTPALFDSDPIVREAAVRGLGSLGEIAVPSVERLAMLHTPPEVAAPLASLTLVGPAGAKALNRIATGHPDPKTRALARTFLGQEPFPRH
jgi:hypothetical protein